MKLRALLNLSLSTTLAVAVVCNAAIAETDVDHLLGELAKPDQPGWEQIEEQIRLEWSKSGSAAMDLLLQRARKALEDEDLAVAIEHLSALIDHDPDFAEARHLRATAYYQSERLGLALEDLRHALALNPRHFAALTGLGIILEALDMEPEALEVLRRAQALNPHRESVREAIERLERSVEGKTL